MGNYKWVKNSAIWLFYNNMLSKGLMSFIVTFQVGISQVKDYDHAIMKEETPSCTAMKLLGLASNTILVCEH